MSAQNTDALACDIAVIGGGPGGYTAAVEAARRGASVILFEADNTLGGTCLNVGCIPTKYLLSAARDLYRIRSMEKAGMLRSSGEYSFRAVMRGKDETVSRLRRGLSSTVSGAGVRIITGEARLTDGRRIICGGATYTADNVIIASGSTAALPPIDGIGLSGDSTAALSLTRVPRRLIVIGGGVIGLELASAYSSFGSETTVLEAAPILLPAIMPEAVALLRPALAARGIKIVTGARVSSLTRAADGTVFVNYSSESGGSTSLAGDFVLCAVGRRPRTDCVDPSLNLTLDRHGFIVADSAGRTNLKHIYAVGDVVGAPMLAHAAEAEARAAVADILGASDAVIGNSGAAPGTSVTAFGGLAAVSSSSAAAPALIPACIYTLPGLASVGMTPGEAELAGHRVAVGRAPFSANGMALACRAGEGAVFAVCDADTTEILGVTAVGEEVCELIDTAAVALSRRFTADDWYAHITAHPTLSEALREAALAPFLTERKLKQ